MKGLRDFIDSYKTDTARKERNELRSRFRVTERGGSLWLTLDGVAFRRIAGTEDAQAVTRFLDEARDAATSFRLAAGDRYAGGVPARPFGMNL